MFSALQQVKATWNQHAAKSSCAGAKGPQALEWPPEATTCDRILKCFHNQFPARFLWLGAVLDLKVGHEEDFHCRAPLTRIL